MDELLINYIFVVCDDNDDKASLKNIKESLKYIFVVDQQKEPHFTEDSFRKMLNAEGFDTNGIAYSVEENKDNQSFIGKQIIAGTKIFQFFLSSPKSVIADIQSKMNKVVENNKDKFVVINMLWNNECFDLSKQAYPCIYTIENNMRELITRFMLDNFGSSWETNYLPDKLKKTRGYKKYEEAKQNGMIFPYENVLFYLNFIDLSMFLFEPYAEQSNCVSKSNWDRLFSKIFDSDKKDFLQDKWKAIYTIRNKVAHNRMLTATDSNDLDILVSEIQPIINAALKKEEPTLILPDEKLPFVKYYISLKLKDNQLKDLTNACGDVCEYLGFGREKVDFDPELSFMSDKPEHIAYLQCLAEYKSKLKRIDNDNLYLKFVPVYRKCAALFYDEYVKFEKEISEDEEIRKYATQVDEQTVSYFSTLPEDITAVTERLKLFYLKSKYKED